MRAQEMQQYLDDRIPLSAAMGVTAVRADPQGVVLSAPLAPNINHRETVFGGSAAAVALLCAWSLLRVRLREHRLDARLVIQRNVMNYEHPIRGDFTAESALDDAAAWQKFVAMLERKRRARIGVTATLHCDGARVGVLDGEFVAVES